MRIANILLRNSASMFISDIGLKFSFFVMSLSGCGIRMMLAFKKSLGVFHILEFFGIICECGGQLFLKCSVKFSCESIWSRAFVCQEFFDYFLNFISCYWSVQVFCFFFIQFWKVIFFQKCVYFTQVFKFLGIQFFVVISYNPLCFCGISCNLSYRISDCVYLGSLSFFLDESV